MRLLVTFLLLPLAAGFTIVPFTSKQTLSSPPTRSSPFHNRLPPSQQQQQQSPPRRSCSRTRRYVLLDVPENFFTFLLPTLSLFLAYSKAVARSRLEERAWEQRLEEARTLALEKDPSLTEIDLLKREAAAEWSAYGNTNNARQEEQERRRVMTRVRDELDTEEDVRRAFTMTPEEIELFQEEFGVEYDPYYDDPYTEDELPEDVPYKVDKLYGDRIYKDGEVFYKDSKSGLYYRQGSQPRIQKFW